jgi:hypothetical protein
MMARKAPLPSPDVDPSTFGAIVRAHGWVTARQLAECVDQVEQLGHAVQLGELMVQKGYITNEQRKIALANQKAHPMRAATREEQRRASLASLDAVLDAVQVHAQEQANGVDAARKITLNEDIEQGEE